jgi:hypothetical protein
VDGWSITKVAVFPFAPKTNSIRTKRNSAGEPALTIASLNKGLIF